MSSASRPSFGNPELLRAMADQILNRQLLHNLCLVNPTFHEAFTPALYYELNINIGNKHVMIAFPEERLEKYCDRAMVVEDIQDNPHLRHTRKLSYTGPGRHLPNYDSPGNLLSIVARMPNLQELVVAEQVLDEKLTRSLVQSCPNLRVIAISHALPRVAYLDAAENDAEEPEQRCRITPDMQHLVPLAGLRSLVLANLCEGLEQWTPHIVSVLKASPLLEEFSLSILGGVGPFDINDHDDLSCKMPDRFAFWKLCLQYVDGGGSPLRLRRLCIGPGLSLASAYTNVESDSDDDSSHSAESISIFPDSSSMEANASDDDQDLRSSDCYLDGLTELAYLEDVYINNPGHFNARTAWEFFSEDRTPRLRRLSALHCDAGLRDFLDDLSPQYIGKLAISFQRFQKVRLSGRLRPFPYYYREYRKADYPPGTSGLRYEPYYFRMFEQNLGADHLLRRENLMDEEVQKKVARVWSTHWSLLTGLYLRLNVNDDDSYHVVESILIKAMADTKLLEQLFINGPAETLEKLALGNRSQHHWYESAIQNFAHNISELATGLRYIKIGHLAWSIERVSPSAVALYPLDRREQLEVERFRPPYEFWPYFNVTNFRPDEFRSASHWSFAGTEDSGRDRAYGG